MPGGFKSEVQPVDYAVVDVLADAFVVDARLLVDQQVNQHFLDASQGV